MPPEHPVLSRNVPLQQTLDIEPVRAEAGESHIRLVVAEKHLRTLGMLHGGVTAATLDTALGYAVMSVAPEGHHAATAQLNINFTRPASLGESLDATGRVLHRGSRTAVASGELRNAAGDLLAAASGTFYFLPIAGGGSADPAAKG